jgi:hypothetical protein
MTALDETKAAKKKAKKEKKKPKKRRRDDDDDDDGNGDDDKKRKRSLKDKKKEKAELMAKVPQKDEHGIAYTKIQIRRMMKRVKRGLPPLETEAEEQERRRQDALMRKEEELELAGMIYKKENDDQRNNDGSVGTGGSEDEDGNSEDDDNDDDDAEENPANLDQEHETSVDAVPLPPKKKTKRSKPVPDDYVCSACQNKHPEPHWIYDCPDKVTMRGTNQKKKKLRGLHDPDPKKVFVSGLPFDAKEKDVQSMFQSCGKVASCKLIKFEDTGRCKGQGYVTFDSEKGAAEALKLSGTIIDAAAATSDSKKNKKKKGDDSSSPTKRKELKIKVSKVLNRKATTRKK